MPITLTGENSFSLQRVLRQMVDEFVAEFGELALQRVDAQEATYERIAETLSSLPFLSSKQLVVLRAPSANKQFAENIEQLMQHVPETTEVIIIEPKLDKRLGYYKYLKKQTDFREFPQLDQNGLSRWLVDEAKSRGGAISSTDARYLVERVGVDQQLLANELEKLLLYDKHVNHGNIDLLTERAPQSTIFQLVEAAFAGNTRQTLALYAEQRALKVEPQQIVALLGWQLHILAVVKTAGERSVDAIAQEARLNPFVVRKTQSIARKLSLAQLKDRVADLVLIDHKMKSAPIDADEALQHYLLKLAV